MKNFTFMGRAFRAADLVWRLTCIGLPIVLAKQFVAELNKWLTNSGPEWAVERLKSLRLDLIRDRSNLPHLTWVRKNRKGQIAGILGSLFRYSHINEKTFKRVLVTFSVYTGFQPVKVSDKAVQKMLDSLWQDSFESPNDLQDIIRTAASRVLGTLRPTDVLPLVMYQGRPGVKSPTVRASLWSREVGSTWEPKSRSVYQDQHLECELSNIFSAPGNEFFCSVYASRYNPLLVGLERTLRLTSREDLHDRSEFHIIGDIYFTRGLQQPPLCGRLVPLTKDGGMKIRWIASPFRIHQLALRPLGEALFGALRTIPWDCTFQQEKPFLIIQNHLKKGRKVHAVDLSSATDYFPLDLQLEVLYTLFPKDRDLVNLFRDLSRGLWSSDWGPVRWTKGQPMGLFPSFPSFALTHGLLLYALNGMKWEESFFVLGDDVVICDDNLHKVYTETLERLHCPYSKDKSLSSDKLTEFAGKVILPDIIYPKFKIKNRAGHHDSFMDLIRAYGPSFRKFFPKRIRKVIERTAQLLPPIGASCSIGPALKLADQVKLTDEFSAMLSEERGGKLHVSFLKFIVSRFSPEDRDSLWYRIGNSIHEVLSTFERKVYAGQKILPVPMIHEDLTDLFEFMDFHPGLPAVRTDSEKQPVTLLSLYERVLERLDRASAR